jgi:hypothetical protein
LVFTFKGTTLYLASLPSGVLIAIFVVSTLFYWLSGLCCLRTLGLITFLVLATYLVVFLRRAVACSDPGLRVLDCPACHFPADLRSQVLTELKDRRFTALIVVTLVTRGLGAPEGVTRRGGVPPEFDLVVTHSSFHVLAIQSISAARAHFAVCVHCLNWGHK